ncbi:hypothetical protein AB4144_02375 [Rhizobiaceae sp. 2RAB30]
MQLHRYGRLQRRSAETASHLFRVGQVVRLKSHLGASLKTAEFYRVTGTLPPRDNSMQYRIRNDAERHERVATEDSLEPVGEPPIAGDGMPPNERTSRHG